jgi:NADH-quinone oxidoreductase subunit A
MMLADVLPPGGAHVSAWAPVALLLVIAIGFAFANIAISILIGPSRTGAVKQSSYESGVVPVGDARRRFNVRFYIVAMIFLVFDVDIIFFYPWATIFAPVVRASAQGATGSASGGAILIEMVVFVAILLLAYFYAWGKGVFRWD